MGLFTLFNNKTLKSEKLICMKLSNPVNTSYLDKVTLSSNDRNLAYPDRRLTQGLNIL